MYYKSVLNEQIVYILFFYILRDAGNWSEYGRHLSPVHLLSFLLQAIDPVHISDTSMHPGGSFLLKQLN